MSTRFSGRGPPISEIGPLPGIGAGADGAPVARLASASATFLAATSWLRMFGR